MTRTWSKSVLLLISTLPLLSCTSGDQVASDGHLDATRDDLAIRIEELLATPLDPATRGRALETLLSDAERVDAADLRVGFEAAAPYMLPSDLQQLAGWWAKRDPVEAMQSPLTASTVPADFWHVQVLRAWAAQSPEAAQQAWQDGACRTSDLCLLALVNGWWESGRDGLWSFVEHLTPGVLRQRAMDVLAARLIVDRGVEEAIRFTEAIDPDASHRFKLQFFRRMATALAVRDSDRAGTWAEEHANGPFGDGLLRRVAVRKVARAGADGMAWVLGLAAGEQRDDAIRAATRRWLQTDRAGALDWFARAEEKPALEPTWEIYSQALARDQPLEALSIVERIDAPEAHDRALVSVLKIWMAQSPDAANAWIEQSDLTEDLIAKARVRASMPRPRKSHKP